MKTYRLKEDKRLAKLPVVFSPEIIQSIESVYRRNYDNQEALVEWKNNIDGVIGYISNPVIAWDNTGKFSHKPNGETYITEGDIDVGFTIKVDNTTNRSYIYVFHINFQCENYGLRESATKIGTVIIEYGHQNDTLQIKPHYLSNKIVVTESDIKNIVLECVCRIISEATINGHTYAIKKQLGKWECIDGIYADYDFSEFGKKGYSQDVRMYMDTTAPKDVPATYCLFRRIDNGKYFYAKIVMAPERGLKKTKFLIVRRSEVPQEILNDFRTLPLPPERVLASPSWRKKHAHSLS